MLKKQSVRLGKIIKKTMRLRGGGSALPGLVVEKINPQFLSTALKHLPYGVVVISGTNGKTTTTKIVVQLLRKAGLRVFTNPSGSNFTRGIVASLLSHVDNAGTLNDIDIAVLELDEAHAVHFAGTAPVDYTLVLNVLRDQLDRFGEIDHTARLLGEVIKKTTKGVILNRDDSLVQALHTEASAEVRYFGVSDELRHLFPSDADLCGSDDNEKHVTEMAHNGDVVLEKMSDQTATFAFGTEQQRPVHLRLEGIHNVLNTAAALALVRMILAKQTVNPQVLLDELPNVRPAFGRGEAVEINGTPLEIVLVKNPSGFRLSLASYVQRPASTLIAINDQYADGRDMSWLWDVDFSSLRTPDMPIQVVSGIRAYDMALRLQYDDIAITHVIPDIQQALRIFLRENTGPKRIYCTYTAMLALRRELAKTYSLEPIE